MKTTFLMTSGLSILLILLMSWLIVKMTVSAFKKKYHPQAAPNLAQSMVLTGRMTAGILLSSGIFFPLRDYLTTASAATAFSSAATWLFLLLCCLIAGITSVLVSLLEPIFAGIVFQGQSLPGELQENNVSVAAVRLTLNIGLALALLFAMELCMQAFVPVPAIPTIG